MYSFMFLIHIGIQPDDDQLNRSKHVAPLNTYTLRCVNCYYIIIGISLIPRQKIWSEPI